MLRFSNKIKYTGAISFSPDSNYFAVGKGKDLIIYNSQTYKQLDKLSFCDYIEDIQWSLNSKLILIGLYKRNMCEVRSIEKKNWFCTIDDSIQGMRYARFSPDGLHILSICNFNIKMIIRSLVDKSTLFIQMPKFIRKGLSFSKNGNFMSLAEKRNGKDLVGVYYTKKWICVNKFFPSTEDLQDIQWTHDGTSLLIQDSPFVCKLYIYSPIGEKINVIEEYQNKLGIKNSLLSPDGHYLCLGLYDQSLRIYNTISYTCVTIFDHSKEILKDNTVNYFVEQLINKSKGLSKYISVRPSIDLRSQIKMPKTNDNLLNKNPPKMGVQKISFSYDGSFLATKNDNMPKVLFVWDMNRMCLMTVLIHLNEVIDFKWSKSQFILFISTGNNKLYYFTLESCNIIEINQGFKNCSLLLSDNGKKMFIKDENNFVIFDMLSGIVEPMNNNDNFYYNAPVPFNNIALAGNNFTFDDKGNNNTDINNINDFDKNNYMTDPRAFMGTGGSNPTDKFSDTQQMQQGEGQEGMGMGTGTEGFGASGSSGKFGGTGTQQDMINNEGISNNQFYNDPRLQQEQYEEGQGDEEEGEYNPDDENQKVTNSNQFEQYGQRSGSDGMGGSSQSQGLEEGEEEYGQNIQGYPNNPQGFIGNRLQRPEEEGDEPKVIPQQQGGNEFEKNPYGFQFEEGMYPSQ